MHRNLRTHTFLLYRIVSALSERAIVSSQIQTQTLPVRPCSVSVVGPF
jgi:hypothetical protein